mgnify:FL=1|jgi:putative flippase GtrA
MEWYECMKALKNNFFQLSRYVSVGAIVNIFAYFLYLFLSNIVSIVAPISAFFSGIIATIASYILHKTYSFKSNAKGAFTLFSFFSLYLAAVIAHSLVIWYFAILLKYPHEIVALLSICLISLSLFIIQKKIIFK